MSSSTSETSQSESSSQEDKNYLEQSGSKKKKQKEEKKKNKNDKKKNKNDKKKNKNKNKKKKHSKKEKKITKLSQITQPVEKRIPKCENCHKKQSQFYCTMCQVFYCAKCEEQIHNISALKKHKKHLYKAPYNELVKKTNFNISRKHNKELSLYCIDENKLICSECYSNYLMIQKIQDSKINHLNLFKKIEIIINTKIETILKGTKKKQKRISKKKIKINTIKKFKKDKNHIKLIQGGKEIIKSERKSEKNDRKRKKRKKKSEGKLEEKEKETETKSEKKRRI
ncbi:fyve-finger-containing rab5 effector protein rabenosyn-5-related [Anaeramoeba flamelloides]|uniref:Fyve-finger-containing rab5 effector protein rabenosyn-5-related n=1 Tax=Anaeramoeba flamelloides TaxID=1746091 RepID=A0AAV7Y4W8_9EUKA|nr:fyve-finger-containing rab5 effector protein rabenosyn-5-related [Anaeramoeba flamelloides]